MVSLLKLVIGSILLLLIGILLGTTSVFYLLAPAPEQEQDSSLETINTEERSVTMKIVAVDEQGNGVTADLVTEIRPGNGLVLVNINDVLADVNTQYSARIAAQVASNYTKISVKNVDVIYNIKTEASFIGGQSAGTIMTISTIAALKNEQVKPHIMATGSVSPTGEIVDAGAIIAKALAAKEDDFTMILVPEGLGTEQIEFKRQKKCMPTTEGEYCRVDYLGERVSIGDQLGIQVREVKTIGEAWKYFEV